MPSSAVVKPPPHTTSHHLQVQLILFDGGVTLNFRNHVKPKKTNSPFCSSCGVGRYEDPPAHLRPTVLTCRQTSLTNLTGLRSLPVLSGLAGLGSR